MKNNKIMNNEIINNEIMNNENENNEIRDNEIKNNEIDNNEIRDNEIKNNEIENNEIRDNEIRDNEIKMPENPPILYPFECDNFQKMAFHAIERGDNVLVTANTGCGKTVIGEYAIAHHIRKGGRVIYTSPIKSLSNEKYRELKEKMTDIKIGILTGDNKIDIDSQCLIITAEILRNSLYKLQNSYENDLYELKNEFINTVTCVVIDEVHFINDYDRGKIWEETIILLDQNIQIIMLSATINNIKQFSNWIKSIRTKKLDIIYGMKRVVPLKHYIYFDNNLHLIQDENDNFLSSQFNITKQQFLKYEKDNHHVSKINVIDNLVKYLKKNDMLQVIFFSFSRANCEKYAEYISTDLIDYESSNQIRNIFDKYMIKYKKEYEIVPQYIKIKSLIERGIAFHHSGLLPILKEIIEIIFKTGLIKVLFATETFAVGINMPTRTVVFTELSKFVQGSKRFLNTAEYKQMSGRAGRRGIDISGNVILLPLYDFPNETDLVNVMLNNMPPIKSKFKIDYSFVLKTKQSIIINSDIFYSKSLLNMENQFLTNNILIEYENLKNKKIILDSSLINIDTSLFLEYFKLINNVTINTHIQIVLSKQQQKKIYNLKKEIYKNDLSIKNYKNYCDLLKLNSHIHNYNIIIQQSDHFLNNIIHNISSILLLYNFIDNSGCLTIKGIIASQINECNCILLTEIITLGLLDDLSSQEIVALLSIFSSYNKIDKDSLNYCPLHIPNKILYIQNIITQFIDLEHQYNINFNDINMWTIITDYVDIAYDWANGMSIAEIISKLIIMNEYEGNFVKNMLKIYNIIHDIICIAKIINNYTLIQKLENIDVLLLRDIVNVNSLYL